MSHGAARLYCATFQRLCAPLLPFPGEAIRTSFQAPRFELTNHLGESLSNEDLRGRVYMMTSVYAHCPAACPMILAQAKRAVASLSEAEQESFSLVAVTMDPERAAFAVRELIKPKQVIPIHYGTYPVINRTPAEFKAALGDAPSEVLVPEPGQALKF